MSYQSTHTDGSPHSTSRGNRRTRGGAGRHNRNPGLLRSGQAGVRICLGCDRPFRSHGPWNRFCHRCHASELDEENTKSYRVPSEWPGTILRELDDF